MNDHYKTLQSGLYALVAIAVTWAIIEYAALPSHGRIWEEIQNAGHFVLFGLLSIGILFILRHSPLTVRSSQSHYVLAFFCTVAAGVLFEIVQMFGPRTASVVDILRDTAGAYTFLSVEWLVRGNNRERVRKTVVVTVFSALITFTWSMWSLFEEVGMGVVRRFEFPTLMVPGAFWNEYRSFNALISAVENPAEFTLNNVSSSLRIEMREGDFAGFAIRDMPENWQEYSSLRFSIYAPEGTEPKRLRIRLFDSHSGWKSGEWLTREHSYARGQRTIRLAIEDQFTDQGARSIDWNSIEQVLIYDPMPVAGFVLFVSDIRLE